MLAYPDIDPILIQIGPLAIRWYGLAYLGGVLAAYLYVKNIFVSEQGFTQDQVLSLVTNIVLGIMLGGRIGYVFFYNFSYFLKHPLSLFAVWEGGMSYHGGAIGAAVAVLVFCWQYKKAFWPVLDLLAISSTFGLFFGRLANFINGELWGRVTDVPWGMVFPGAGVYPRHPSQLYEALLEGLVLFFILHLLRTRSSLKSGQLFGAYLGCYGVFRFVIEFFREPDAQLGFVVAWMSMGQVLCVVMMILGSLCFVLNSDSRATK
jgi:phosphatidylglycerol:prolipoprotein diacylglycerol transferase